jgi:phosphatidylglycerol---prolipoprotein diacylglyceryl transferase
MPRRTEAEDMMTLALPFPAIDPALFTLQVGGFQFSLRWYALAYLAGLGLGWWIVRALMRRPQLWPGGQAPMTPQDPGDLVTWIALGVIAGGRIGYVLFYQPIHFLTHPWEIPMIWTGGMSFHGGFLGAALAVLLWARGRDVRLWSAGDAVALATPPALFFGRLANFVNGELWGRPSGVPWAMVFPDPRAGGVPRHPSQLYQAALEGLALGALIWWLATRRGWLGRPGAMVGAFVGGYGVARLIGEGFRQADAQFVSPDNPFGHVIRLGSEAGSLGLTMGQTLSLPMIAVGAAIIALAFARRAREA